MAAPARPAKPSVPKFPDQIVNGCLVGKTRSGWAWGCLGCGEGEITGGGKINFKWRAEDAARNHKCEDDATCGD